MGSGAAMLDEDRRDRLLRLAAALETAAMCEDHPVELRRAARARAARWRREAEQFTWVCRAGAG
jgi:hypothetical protein